MDVPPAQAAAEGRNVGGLVEGAAAPGKNLQLLAPAVLGMWKPLTKPPSQAGQVTGDNSVSIPSGISETGQDRTGSLKSEEATEVPMMENLPWLLGLETQRGGALAV